VQEIRAGLAFLRAADPVLARMIDGRPDFDPDVWVRRLPVMGLFGSTKVTLDCLDAWSAPPAASIRALWRKTSHLR
jgi:hypothetical protein